MQRLVRKAGTGGSAPTERRSVNGRSRPGGRRSTFPQSGGWIALEGARVIGAGPGVHAAWAVAQRRGGGPGADRPRRVVPVAAAELDTARAKLPGRGLTLAEAAWCEWLLVDEPTYGEAVVAGFSLPAAARRVDPTCIRDTDLITFRDGSSVELLVMRRRSDGRNCVLARLPEPVP